MQLVSETNLHRHNISAFFGSVLGPKPTGRSHMQHPASCKAENQHAALLDAYGIYVLNHGCAPTGLPSSKLTPAGSERAV